MSFLHKSNVKNYWDDINGRPKAGGVVGMHINSLTFYILNTKFRLCLLYWTIKTILSTLKLGFDGETCSRQGKLC